MCLSFSAAVCQTSHRTKTSDIPKTPSCRHHRNDPSSRLHQTCPPNLATQEPNHHYRQRQEDSAARLPQSTGYPGSTNVIGDNHRRRRCRGKAAAERPQQRRGGERRGAQGSRLRAVRGDQMGSEEHQEAGADGTASGTDEQPEAAPEADGGEPGETVFDEGISG